MLVDETDIDSIYKFDIEAANQSKYVAFSRASLGVIANTKGKIMNKDHFDFDTTVVDEMGIDNLAIDIDETTLKNLIKDGIANKTCK